jgi:putative alpha-1,2-mannosidase
MADAGAASRLRIALALYQVGEEMQRARLRREHPDASLDEIEDAVREWRRRRPGAPDGDAVGRPSRRFE